MGHSVTGLIAESKLLTAFALKCSLHSPILMNQGVAFLPLRAEDIDKIIPSPQIEWTEGFIYLSKQLMNLISAASKDGFVIYVETDYFGGIGAQGAVGFCDGNLVFGPKKGEFGPIDEALELLGIKVVAPAVDEFESVGLNLYRDNEDWLEAKL